MRVAAYIRVSTEEQADLGNSLTEQRERLAAHCRSKGWDSPTFFEDDGYSAKDMKRPAAQRMIDRAPEFDFVLTTKLDRMSRNLLDMLKLVKHLETHNCQFVSASEGFDTSTAVGKMVMQLLAVFAEFERERIGERVKDNMMSLARNTKMALGRSVYGLGIDNKQYVIDASESVVVELMATFAEQGSGFRGIASKLNEMGHRTRVGTHWDDRSVKRVLENPAISGTMIFNKRKTKDGKTTIRDREEWIIKEDNHPAIIEKERQRKILSLLESRKPSKKHAESDSYLLSGILLCGHCGKPMTGSTSRVRRGDKKYDYYKYICSTYSKGQGCKYHSVHRDELEKPLIDYIKKLITSGGPNLAIEMPESIFAGEMEEFNKRLDRIERRIQRQIEAYGEELITASDLKKATEKAEKERGEIYKAVDNIKNRKPDVKKFKKSAEALLLEIVEEDRVKSKLSLRKLLSRIEMFDGRYTSVIFRAHV